MGKADSLDLEPLVSIRRGVPAFSVGERRAIKASVDREKYGGRADFGKAQLALATLAEPPLQIEPWLNQGVSRTTSKKIFREVENYLDANPRVKQELLSKFSLSVERLDENPCRTFDERWRWNVDCPDSFGFTYGGRGNSMRKKAAIKSGKERLNKLAVIAASAILFRPTNVPIEDADGNRIDVQIDASKNLSAPGKDQILFGASWTRDPRYTGKSVFSADPARLLDKVRKEIAKTDKQAREQLSREKEALRLTGAELEQF